MQTEARAGNNGGENAQGQGQTAAVTQMDDAEVYQGPPRDPDEAIEKHSFILKDWGGTGD